MAVAYYISLAKEQIDGRTARMAVFKFGTKAEAERYLEDHRWHMCQDHKAHSPYIAIGPAEMDKGWASSYIAWYRRVLPPNNTGDDNG